MSGGMDWENGQGSNENYANKEGYVWQVGSRRLSPLDSGFPSFILAY